MIKRKWEWVKEELEGLEEDPFKVKVAERIDKAIHKEFGDTHTEDWIKQYKKIQKENAHLTMCRDERLTRLETVMNSAGNCTPCVELKMVCGECPVSKEWGAHCFHANENGYAWLLETIQFELGMIDNGD